MAVCCVFQCIYSNHHIIDLVHYNISSHKFPSVFDEDQIESTGKIGLRTF